MKEINDKHNLETDDRFAKHAARHNVFNYCKSGSVLISRVEKKIASSFMELVQLSKIKSVSGGIKWPRYDVDNNSYGMMTVVDEKGIVDSIISNDESLPKIQLEDSQTWIRNIDGLNNSIGIFYPGAKFSLFQGVTSSPQFGSVQLFHKISTESEIVVSPEQQMTIEKYKQLLFQDC
ncbi:hypothetical protein GEMRC1_012969 [Eukaryota sp. GEM-RC1]